MSLSLKLATFLHSLICSSQHSKNLRYTYHQAGVGLMSYLSTQSCFKSFFNVLIFIVKYCVQQDALDRYLLGSNGIIVTPAACTPPFVVSKQMEQLVIENFDVINDFEECFQTIYKQAFLRRSVDEPFLNRFRDIIDRVCIYLLLFWTWYSLFLSSPQHAKRFCDASTVDLSLFTMNYLIISVQAIETTPLVLIEIFF